MGIRVEIHVGDAGREHIELIDIGNDALQAVAFRFDDTSNPSHVAMQTLAAAMVQKLDDLANAKGNTAAIDDAVEAVVEAQAVAIRMWGA